MYTFNLRLAGSGGSITARETPRAKGHRRDAINAGLDGTLGCPKEGGGRGASVHGVSFAHEADGALKDTAVIRHGC